MEKEPITSQCLEKIKKELEELKNIKRPKIIEAIAEARAHGDLKENAEYHAAKEEQSKIEGRKIKINDLIARANVIDVTKLEKKDKVVFGSTVSLIDLKSNKSKTYKIRGIDKFRFLDDNLLWPLITVKLKFTRKLRENPRRCVHLNYYSSYDGLHIFFCDGTGFSTDSSTERITDKNNLKISKF